MTQPDAARIEQMTQSLGREIFERAAAHEPGVWQPGWYKQRLLDYVAQDAAFQSRAYRFIEALPYMHDDADVARHLREYLAPLGDGLPTPLHMVLRFKSPRSVWGRTVGSYARRAALVMARSFITGTNTTEAIQNAVRLRARGMAFTLDVLGEATHSEARADQAAQTYLDLIESLGRAARHWPPVAIIDSTADGPMPRANISIKLTALAPVFDPATPDRSRDAVWSRLSRIFERARELNVFVNIDMEQFRYRDLTLDLFTHYCSDRRFRDWSGVGIVVQAYLRDSERDLDRLLEFARTRGTGFAIRLVKGAYWDTETTAAIRHNTAIPVWTRKWQTDASYERLTLRLMQHADRVRPALASHNVRSLAHAMSCATTLGLDARAYEVQMLAGMGDSLKQAVARMGRCVRIYCPYGDLVSGMAYLIRRLLENTSNDSFLRQRVSRHGDERLLLVNPEQARPPSGALPSVRFDHTFEEFAMDDFQNAVATSFASPDNRGRLSHALERARAQAGGSFAMQIDAAPVETSQWIESHNPADPQQIVGRAARAGAEHVAQAVRAARTALPDWSGTPATQRCTALTRAADILERRRFDLCAHLMLEIGKTARQADAEVTEAIDYCRYHAQLADRLARHPRSVHLPGEQTVMLYDPCGVCVLLGSWDFPLALVVAMASAALAAGNTCIIKPSSRAPLAAARFVEVLGEAGIPRRAVQLLNGPGADIGQGLVAHADVDVVVVCGSSETALAVHRTAAAGESDRFKRVVIDAGAKNAIIIDDDVDLDEAITGVLESAFSFSGQKCTACSRAIVLDRAYDAFCNKIAGALATWTIGDPADLTTDLGPLIDKDAADSVQAQIQAAQPTCRVIYPTGQVALPASGHYVAPTVIADVNPDSPLARREIFGPVLAVLRAADFDHALALANDSRYALTGGLYSRSPAHIDAARAGFRVGNLYINRPITGSQVNVQPYGGWRLSGDGARLGGPEYLLHFCRTRTISENTMRHGLADTVEDPDHVRRVPSAQKA